MDALAQRTYTHQRPPRVRPMCSHRQAFMLIELLAVIGIIALLLALLRPTIGRMKERAIRMLCVSHQPDLARIHQA